MTYQAALKRLQQGEALYLHTPDAPTESFYFFGTPLTTVSLPVGRRLRELPDLVTLLTATPEFPDSPYFHWKLAPHVTPEETRSSLQTFDRFDRFEEARALQSRFPKLLAP